MEQWFNLEKKMFKIIMLFLISNVAIAAPFLISDPTTQDVSHCGIYLDNSAVVESVVDVQASGVRCKFDVSFVSNGAHKVSATFIKNDPVWGRVESVPSTPLNFVRPANPSNAPINLNLIK